MNVLDILVKRAAVTAFIVGVAHKIHVCRIPAVRRPTIVREKCSRDLARAFFSQIK